MKISFGAVNEFRQECIDRDIHEVRRDYAAETKPAQVSNKEIGSVGITRFKLILTATDGKDLLRLEHPFYSCLSMVVNEEKTKKEVEERIEKVEEQLQKDFPPAFLHEVSVYGKTELEDYKFTLKRGVIEEV